MSEQLSLTSASSRRPSLLRNVGADHSVDAFVFDHVSGEGAFVLSHHLVHQDNENNTRHVNYGNVQVVSVRMDQASEWFAAYTIGKAVVFR
jgi:hypothetical protein